jgi:hypothetical protein
LGDRFVDKGAGAQGKGQVFLGQDGADDDWDVSRERVLPQPGEDFPAIDLGHHNIQHDRPGRGFLGEQ